MKENVEYLKDLRDVRLLMERSSKFLSLSGVSGIMAGLYALICAYMVYADLFHSVHMGRGELPMLLDTFETRISLLGYGSVTLVLALATGIILTLRKARKKQQKVFSKPAFQLFFSLLIPLVIGGIACLIMILKGELLFVGSLTLIFYGLSLINASVYTYSDIKGLGLVQCFLGLLSLYFTGYSLLFWALGFGVAHIIYGVIMHFKYDKG